MRFYHPVVIDSYRENPDHIAFADDLFRPIAGDRISIDYRAVEGYGTTSENDAASRKST